MSAKLNVIAIDGPAGSGKSTVAKGVAKELGFFYIDTGAMYRTLTLKAMRGHLDLTDGKELARLSHDTDIKLKNQSGFLKVFLDGEDVTDKIRDLSVTEKVKFVARVEAVRHDMVKIQRALGESQKGAVLEGRDIGTVVFPDAKYKFYLDAAFKERVKRRFKEFKTKGMDISEENVRKDLEARDYSDKTRAIGPLKQAEDAVYLDTTSLTIEEVISKILSKIEDIPNV